MEKLVCRDRGAWRDWLSRNRDTSAGVWLVFGKTKTLETVKAQEALEEALCFGWIDGQLKPVDDDTYIKKFTPRRKGSKWSVKNRKTAAGLIKAGLMTEAGQTAIERAKAEGTWDTPKAPPITEEQVGVLIKALEGHSPALGNLMNMAQSVKRTYTALYLDAKSEATRTRRLTKIIERLNENKKPM